MPTNSDEQRELSHEERYIIKSLWSIESNTCSAGLVKEKIDKIDKYVESVLKEPTREFIKQIHEIRDLCMMDLDYFNCDTLRERCYRKIDVKKYVQSIGECLECTAKILYKFGELNDEEKQQDSDLVAEKLKIIEEISQKSKSKQNARRAYCALGSGAVIGAAIAYLAGAATLAPAIVAVAVFIAATVVGALVGYGIGKFCEKVSEEKQNDPDMSMCTAIKNVFTPKCLKSQSQVHP
ncbi:uncharacterized protein TNCT_605191 [Trichonephila clavata]|uniref:Uncharacterized protein n=1 Tax=Trichonephila clavata TaxID=2740835 RepID=A0A8X6HCF8_TRICU|nr:uncharacterized protein TNCT_694701 [Trichonephila clavata]GFQ94846.1 uncharacterized protein TNCT_611151 [Trichonephila clavata]GFR20818.1 uncharacterized protein TNCT_198281 [Trichonephila clavata]GFR26933.1 uncharacterized protein TNCT_605191 [Trichonephila clavata]